MSPHPSHAAHVIAFHIPMAQMGQKAQNGHKATRKAGYLISSPVAMCSDNNQGFELKRKNAYEVGKPLQSVTDYERVLLKRSLVRVSC